MVLVFHVISQDQMVKGSCEPIKVSYHPAKFCGHSHSGSAVIMILVCHVISQDHMIKESYEFMGRKSPPIK